MDMSRMMPDINKYLDDDMNYLEPSIDSPEGLNVPGLVSRYGNVYKKMKDLPQNGPILFKTLYQAKQSYKALKHQPISGKKLITDRDLKELESMIRDLDIDEIGYAEVEAKDIFSNKRILFPNAIVMIMEMKEDKIQMAPSIDTSLEIYRTYHNLGVAVNKIARYLKDKGYKAEAGPAIGGEVNYPMLAEKAGLGALGKHGLLITPKYGPSVRIATVYTEIENLPMARENKHEWIKDFCSKCNKCVDSCIAGAIYKEPQMVRGSWVKHIDYKKCAEPFSNVHGCTLCVKHCTFFTKGYDEIHKRVLAK